MPFAQEVPPPSVAPSAPTERRARWLTRPPACYLLLVSVRYYASLWNERCYREPAVSLAELGARCRAAGLGLEMWPYALSLDPYRVAHRRAVGGESGVATKPATVLEICDTEHRTAVAEAVGDVHTVWHSRFLNDPGSSLPRYLSPAQHREQIDTAAAMGSHSIAIHELGDEVSALAVGDDPLGVARHVIDYAAAAGLHIAFEAWRSAATVAACARYPSLRVCVDPAALVAHDPSASFSLLLGDVAERICMVHAYEHQHLPPGTDPQYRDTWQQLLHHLDDVAGEVAFVFEFGPQSDHPRAVNELALDATLRARDYLESLR